MRLAECRIKTFYQTEKKLWHDLLRKRTSLELRMKIKSDISNDESNIVENSKIHPKLLYIKDKTNIRESVRALHGDNGSILSNPRNICHKFNVWFHSVFHLEDLSNMPQFSLCDIPSCPVVFFDPEDISDRLKNLDGNKSIGPDAVNPYALKQCYSLFYL